MDKVIAGAERIAHLNSIIYGTAWRACRRECAYASMPALLMKSLRYASMARRLRGMAAHNDA